MSRATPGSMSAKAVINEIVRYLEESGYPAGKPARLRNSRFDDRYVWTVWVYPNDSTSRMEDGAKLTFDPKSMDLLVEAVSASFRREIEHAIHALR